MAISDGNQSILCIKILKSDAGLLEATEDYTRIN